MARKGKKQEAEEDTLVLPPDAARPALRLADHPRAVGQIRTVRAWVALSAFLLILLLSLRSGNPPESALSRALEAGVVGYLLGWAAMVLAWRQLAQAEIERARRRIVEAMLELEAAERGGGMA